MGQGFVAGPPILTQQPLGQRARRPRLVLDLDIEQVIDRSAGCQFRLGEQTRRRRIVIEQPPLGIERQHRIADGSQDDLHVLLLGLQCLLGTPALLHQAVHAPDGQQDQQCTHQHIGDEQPAHHLP